jgi:hypothetical protein
MQLIDEENHIFGATNLIHYGLGLAPRQSVALFSHLKSQWQELFCHQVCNAGTARRK